MRPPPTLRDDLPHYPLQLQLLRLTAATVPGPTGFNQPVLASSLLAPRLYVAFTQQHRTDSLLPTDREPCLADDVKGRGLSPGFYLGRLSNSWTSLPVYEVIAPVSEVILFGDHSPVHDPRYDPPSSPDIVNLYYDTTLNVTWVWNPITRSWVSTRYFASYFQWIPTYISVFNTGSYYTLLDSDVKLAFATAGSITINGFIGGVNGRVLIVWNRGTGKVTLKHSLTQPNGIICPLHTDYVLWPDDGVILEYDGTSRLWRFDCPTLGTAGSAGATLPEAYATRQINFGNGITYTNNGDGSVDVSVVDIDTSACITDFGSFIQGSDYTVTTTWANTGLSKTFNFDGDVHISFTVQGSLTPVTLQEALNIRLADGAGAPISGTDFTVLQAQVANQAINGMGTIVYSTAVANGDTIQLQAAKQNATSTTKVNTNSRITWFRLC